MTFVEEMANFRTEQAYPELFGELNPRLIALPEDLFRGAFGIEEINHDWLKYGILTSQANEARNSCLYVTSGLSNPFNEDAQAEDQPSGYGVECTLECSEPCDWGVNLMMIMMAYQLVLPYVHNPEAYIDYGHCVPLQGDIVANAESEIRWLFATPSDRYENRVTLASGAFDLLHFIGITESEQQYATEHGADALYGLLQENGYHLITDPTRESVVPSE